MVLNKTKRLKLLLDDSGDSLISGNGHEPREFEWRIHNIEVNKNDELCTKKNNEYLIRK